MSSSQPGQTGAVVGERIQAILDRLAGLERLPGSEGERAAAEIIGRELERCGARVRIERETVHGTYWVPIGVTCAAAAAFAAGGRAFAAMGGALCTVSAVDDLEIGGRPLRRLLAQRIATNVVAELRGPQPKHTLVIHAHHDAARSGLVFNPAIAKLAARMGGAAIERLGGTPAPMWGAVLGPGMVALGGLLGRSRLRIAGAMLCAAYALAMVDIARSPAVPGANDNLSGVCVLLAVAESLARRPPRRLRVLLLSTGSEESFLETMERFGERHFRRLSPQATTFLCVESVGSPQLMLLSGEGLLRLHRYGEDPIRTLSRLAQDAGIPLHKPFRYRLATDGQVPLRAGYPTAAISSMDWYKAPSNYHWPSDRPENMDLGSVARAARLAEGFVADLDERAGREA